MKTAENEAEIALYLDENRPKKDGTCSIKIKVTYNRKRKYYATGRSATKKDFEKIFFNAERRTKTQKDLQKFVARQKQKAEDVIEELKVFSFYAFEERYRDNRGAKDSVSFAFDQHIKDLKNESRIGTAVSYECAKNSIEAHTNDLTFAEVTPSFLKSYERWMLSNGKSKSTIGIYLRSLRTIYNQQTIDKSAYPFGVGKNKYSIPTSRNIKKALTVEEIAKMYAYQAPINSTMEKAKDYWFFLFLCNGMNVKDFCLLRWENIQGTTLRYVRAKTERSQREEKEIEVALKPESLEVIKKYAIRSIDKTAFIFPHLQKGMSAEDERKVYQQLTKTINKYIKKIAVEVGIDKQPTTYYARHSFATILKNSGTNVAMISELLGHSSISVTENYLSSFEKEQIQKETDVLTAALKSAI